MSGAIVPNNSPAEQASDVLDGVPLKLPRILHVDRGEPWRWLALGWDDLMTTPVFSIGFGAVYAVVGLAILFMLLAYEQFFWVLPLAGAFFIFGPVTAVGLYHLSRQRAEGRSIDLNDALTAWRHNPTQILFIGVILLLINLFWVRAAALIFFLFFNDAPPRPEIGYMLDVLVSAQALPFLTTGTLVGLVLAVITFSLTVIAIPLLLDRRDSNVVIAMAASVTAVRENPWTLGIWAWLIVLFVGAGIAAGFIGLAVTLPLIGHASWHAYKATIVWDDDPVEAVTEDTIPEAASEQTPDADGA